MQIIFKKCNIQSTHVKLLKCWCSYAFMLNMAKNVKLMLHHRGPMVHHPPFASIHTSWTDIYKHLIHRKTRKLENSSRAVARGSEPPVLHWNVGCSSGSDRQMHLSRFTTSSHRRTSRFSWNFKIVSLCFFAVLTSCWRPNKITRRLHAQNPSDLNCSQASRGKKIK